MANEKEYNPNRAALWNRNSDNPKAPVAGGTLEITIDLLNSLTLEENKQGQQVFKLDIALWINNNKTGPKSPDFYGTISEPYVKEEQQEGQHF